MLTHIGMAHQPDNIITGAITLRESTVPVRVDTHRDQLLAVKRGAPLWPAVDVRSEHLHHHIEHALTQTHLS